MTHFNPSHLSFQRASFYKHHDESRTCSRAEYRICYFNAIVLLALTDTYLSRPRRRSSVLFPLGTSTRRIARILPNGALIDLHHQPVKLYYGLRLDKFLEPSSTGFQRRPSPGQDNKLTASILRTLDATLGTLRNAMVEEGKGPNIVPEDYRQRLEMGAILISAHTSIVCCHRPDTVTMPRWCNQIRHRMTVTQERLEVSCTLIHRCKSPKD